MGVARTILQHSYTMLENVPPRDAGTATGAFRHRGACEKILPGLMLLTLVRATEALAGEQPVFSLEPPKTDFSGPRQAEHARSTSLPLPSVPLPYQAAPLPAIDEFSARDFRPHGASIDDQRSKNSAFQDTPMLRGTTVWQRMSEFRTHGRVRVLTLWETGGSSVSLQAGKKGEPSLQWTSALMNHGGPPHGLLDQLFSTSIAGAARTLHWAPRSGSEPASRQQEGGANK